MTNRFRLLVATLCWPVLIVSCSSPSAPPEEPKEESRLSGSVALMAWNMMYVAADLNAPADTAVLVSDRSAIGPWETFTVVELDSGRIALKTSNDRYVTADRERGGLLLANRTEVGAWERFEVVNVTPDLVALRNSNGYFVSADLNKGGILVADRLEAGKWERFAPVPVVEKSK